LLGAPLTPEAFYLGCHCHFWRSICVCI